MFIVATKVIEELQFEVITMLQLEHWLSCNSSNKNYKNYNATLW
jgi:hypothetical protein